jgi:hypothetical protein
MKIRINKTFLFLLLSFLCFPSFSQEPIPEKLILSLHSGDAKTLSGFFNDNIELVVLENDNVYSKAQAQQIVNEFFANHKPEKFSIIHQGGKDGSKYVIGSLTTKKGSLRVYFLIKVDQGNSFIHQLRIEKQV